MRAESILRIAANPNAVSSLSTAELCELLAEDTPPAWVLEEAARRADERVRAHLFSHPHANPSLLERAVGTDTGLLDRLNHHVKVAARPVSVSHAFGSLVPEAPLVCIGDARLVALLANYLSPLSLTYLTPAPGEVQQIKPTGERVRLEGPDAPRAYTPLARFLLLGDFLYYLTCPPVATPRDLPVTAKVALALNLKQLLEPYSGDADVRVRLAANERESWSGN